MSTFCYRFFWVWAKKQCFFDPHPQFLLISRQKITFFSVLFDRLFWFIWHEIEHEKLHRIVCFDRCFILENCVSQLLYGGNSYPRYPICYPLYIEEDRKKCFHSIMLKRIDVSIKLCNLNSKWTAFNSAVQLCFANNIQIMILIII